MLTQYNSSQGPFVLDHTAGKWRAGLHLPVIFSTSCQIHIRPSQQLHPHLSSSLLSSTSLLGGYRPPASDGEAEKSCQPLGAHTASRTLLFARTWRRTRPLEPQWNIVNQASPTLVERLIGSRCHCRYPTLWRSHTAPL